MTRHFSEPPEIPSDIDAFLRHVAERLVLSGCGWKPAYTKSISNSIKRQFVDLGVTHELAEAWSNEVLGRIDRRMIDLRSADAHLSGFA